MYYSQPLFVHCTMIVGNSVFTKLFTISHLQRWSLNFSLQEWVKTDFKPFCGHGTPHCDVHHLHSEATSWVHTDAMAVLAILSKLIMSETWSADLHDHEIEIKLWLSSRYCYRARWTQSIWTGLARIMIEQPVQLQLVTSPPNDNLSDREVITIVIMLERLQASCMAAVSDEDPPPKDVMTDSPEGKFHPV